MGQSELRVLEYYSTHSGEEVRVLVGDKVADMQNWDVECNLGTAWGELAQRRGLSTVLRGRGPQGQGPHQYFCLDALESLTCFKVKKKENVSFSLIFFFFFTYFNIDFHSGI